MVRSLCTPIHLESCLSRVFISAFRDAAGAGAGAGAGACVGAGEGRSSSLRWIIFNPSSASRTLQMDMMDLLVFLFVCPRTPLVGPRATKEANYPRRRRHGASKKVRARAAEKNKKILQVTPAFGRAQVIWSSLGPRPSNLVLQVIWST